MRIPVGADHRDILRHPQPPALEELHRSEKQAGLIHDLNATILHLLGFDHTQLTYRAQGRDFRLTDVHGHVVKKILA